VFGDPINEEIKSIGKPGVLSGDKTLKKNHSITY